MISNRWGDERSSPPSSMHPIPETAGNCRSRIFLMHNLLDPAWTDDRGSGVCSLVHPRTLPSGPLMHCRTAPFLTPNLIVTHARLLHVDDRYNSTPHASSVSTSPAERACHRTDAFPALGRWERSPPGRETGILRIVCLAAHGF